jgi:dynein heavy chain, axonemal
MEKTLAKLQETWKDIKFEFYQHRNTDIQLIRLTDENFDLLEENTNQASSMQSSRYIATFETEVERWTKSLSNITEILTISAEVQRNWAYLENLFLGSDEVKKELPEQAKQFVFIDQEVKRILKDASEKQYTIVFCDQDWVLKSFDNVYNHCRFVRRPSTSSWLRSKSASPDSTSRPPQTCSTFSPTVTCPSRS